jgi:hypothetical protein
VTVTVVMILITAADDDDLRQLVVTQSSNRGAIPPPFSYFYARPKVTDTLLFNISSAKVRSIPVI